MSSLQDDSLFLHTQQDLSAEEGANEKRGILPFDLNEIIITFVRLKKTKQLIMIHKNFKNICKKATRGGQEPRPLVRADHHKRWVSHLWSQSGSVRSQSCVHRSWCAGQEWVRGHLELPSCNGPEGNWFFSGQQKQRLWENGFKTSGRIYLNPFTLFLKLGPGPPFLIEFFAFLLCLCDSNEINMWI